MSAFMNPLTLRALLPIWVILLLIAMLDIKFRLIGESVTANDNWHPDTYLLRSVDKLTSQQAELITAVLNSYEQEKIIDSAAKSNNSMSQEEQAAQQGKLKQLYIDDFRYRLVGIFTQTTNFAVFIREDMNEEGKQVIKIKEEDALGDYQVTLILANEVQLLASDGRSVNLQLFENKN